MKDRIRKIMESQHMTQQVFAQSIGLSPATLSSIYNGRTNPTLNIVEAIKKKIPNISIDWLMFGTGEMYVASSDGSGSSDVVKADVQNVPQETLIDFNQSSTPTPSRANLQTQNFNSVRSTRPEIVREEVKFVDKPQRRVIEIRVFYDDQTWDTFVPVKK